MIDKTSGGANAEVVFNQLNKDGWSHIEILNKDETYIATMEDLDYSTLRRKLFDYQEEPTVVNVALDKDIIDTIDRIDIAKNFGANVVVTLRQSPLMIASMIYDYIDCDHGRKKHGHTVLKEAALILEKLNMDIAAAKVRKLSSSYGSLRRKLAINILKGCIKANLNRKGLTNIIY